jgi:hypothetical protein
MTTLGQIGPRSGADLEHRARRYAAVAAALDHTHMQEGIARPIGKLYEAEPLFGVVPFDYGLDRGPEGASNLLGARSRCRSEARMAGENGGGKVCHGSGGIVPQLAE